MKSKWQVAGTHLIDKAFWYVLFCLIIVQGIRPSLCCSVQLNFGLFQNITKMSNVNRGSTMTLET